MKSSWKHLIKAFCTRDTLHLVLVCSSLLLLTVLISIPENMSCISSQLVKEIDSQEWGVCGDSAASIESPWNTLEGQTVLERIQKVQNTLAFYDQNFSREIKIQILAEAPFRYDVKENLVTLGSGLLSTESFERSLFEAYFMKNFAEDLQFKKASHIEKEIFLDVLVRFSTASESVPAYPYWSVGLYCESADVLPRHVEVCQSLKESALRKSLAMDYQNRMILLQKMRLGHQRIDLKSLQTKENVLNFAQQITQMSAQKVKDNSQERKIILLTDHSGITEIEPPVDFDISHVMVTHQLRAHYLKNKKEFDLSSSLKSLVNYHIHVLASWSEIDKVRFEMGRNLVIVGKKTLYLKGLLRNDMEQFARSNPEFEFMDVWKNEMNQKNLKQLVESFVKDQHIPQNPEFAWSPAKELVEGRLYQPQAAVDTILYYTPINRVIEPL